MFTTIETASHKGKMYHLAESGVGKILYYQYSNYTQYKNLTQHETCWNIVKTEEFELLFSKPAVHIIASKRLKGMNTVHKFKVSDSNFHILDNRDGLYYVVDNTMLRMFPESEYPNAKFVYQIFSKEALRTFDFSVLARTFEEETTKFNGDYSAAPYIMSSVLQEVLELAKNEPVEEEVMQISLF